MASLLVVLWKIVFNLFAFMLYMQYGFCLHVNHWYYFLESNFLLLIYGLLIGINMACLCHMISRGY